MLSSSSLWWLVAVVGGDGVAMKQVLSRLVCVCLVYLCVVMLFKDFVIFEYEYKWNTNSYSCMFRFARQMHANVFKYIMYSRCVVCISHLSCTCMSHVVAIYRHS